MKVDLHSILKDDLASIKKVGNGNNQYQSNYGKKKNTSTLRKEPSSFLTQIGLRAVEY